MVDTVIGTYYPPSRRHATGPIKSTSFWLALLFFAWATCGTLHRFDFFLRADGRVEGTSDCKRCHQRQEGAALGWGSERALSLPAAVLLARARKEGDKKQRVNDVSFTMSGHTVKTSCRVWSGLRGSERVRFVFVRGRERERKKERKEKKKARKDSFLAVISNDFKRWTASQPEDLKPGWSTVFSVLYVVPKLK